MQGRTLEENINDFRKLTNFLNTRRNDQTREYTRIILDEIRGGEEVDIRSVLNKLVPVHIPNESTFFRIIKDLSDPKWGILERREDPTVIRRGKAPVFYKLKIHLHWPRPPEKIHHSIEHDDLVRIYRQLSVAKEIIAEDREISYDDVGTLIERESIKKWGDPKSKYARFVPDDEDET